MEDYKSFIEINPNKRFGKPCLKGSRISVYDVKKESRHSERSEESHLC